MTDTAERPDPDTAAAHSERTEAPELEEVIRDPFLLRVARGAVHVSRYKRWYAVTAAWALALALFPVVTGGDPAGAPVASSPEQTVASDTAGDDRGAAPGSGDTTGRATVGTPPAAGPSPAPAPAPSTAGDAPAGDDSSTSGSPTPGWDSGGDPSFGTGPTSDPGDQPGQGGSGGGAERSQCTTDDVDGAPAEPADTVVRELGSLQDAGEATTGQEAPADAEGTAEDTPACNGDTTPPAAGGTTTTAPDGPAVEDPTALAGLALTEALALSR